MSDDESDGMTPEALAFWQRLDAALAIAGVPDLHLVGGFDCVADDEARQDD